MPSPTSTPRKPQSRVATARARAAASALARPAQPTPQPDVRTEARQARTLEFMRAEHEREAALSAQGYWF